MYANSDYIHNSEEGAETVTFFQNLKNSYNVSTSGCTYIALKIKHFLSRYRQKTKQEFYSKVKSCNFDISNINIVISSVFKESVHEKVFDHFSEELFHIDELTQSHSKQIQMNRTQILSDQKQCQSKLICHSVKSEVTSFGLEDSVENLELDEVMDKNIAGIIIEGINNFQNASNKENNLPVNKDLQTTSITHVQIGLKYEDELFNLQIGMRPDLKLIDLKEIVSKKCFLPSLDFDLFYYDSNVDENILLENVSSVWEKMELLIKRRNIPFESYENNLKEERNNAKRKCLLSDGTIMLQVQLEEVYKNIFLEEPFESETVFSAIRKAFSLNENQKFLLQLYDPAFENYFDIENYQKIKDNDKLKITIQECDIVNHKNVIGEASLSLSRETSPICTESIHNGENTSSKSRDKTWMAVYSLPSFPEKIEEKLKNGDVLKDVERAVVSSAIANSVFPHTFYPGKGGYEFLIDLLLSTYPQLRRIGYDTAKESWYFTLRNRFNNSRQRDLKDCPQIQSRQHGKRQHKDTTSEVFEASSKRRSVRAALGIANYCPTRPKGETDASVEEHINLMKKEKQSRNPNFSKVEVSMAATFADRRKKIVGGASVTDMCEEYPWLLSENEVFLEFQRLTNEKYNIEAKLLEGFGRILSPMIDIYNVLKKKADSTVNKISGLGSKKTKLELIEARNIIVVSTVAECLNEKIESIFKEEEDSDTSLYILCVPTRFEKGSEYCCIVEGLRIRCSSMLSSFTVFFIVHYVFNLVYSMKIHKTMTFIQKHILEMVDSTAMPAPVVRLIRKIKETLISKVR